MKRVAAIVAVLCISIAAIALVIRPGITEPYDPVLPSKAESPQLKPLVAKLAREGVDVTPPEHQALRLLLRRWSARPDLQAISSEPNGDVSLPQLLAWALATRDGDLQLTAAWRPELLSLQWHAGYVADGESVALALLANVRNGVKALSPDADFDAAVLEAALVIDERPDVRTQVVQDGRLDAGRALQWAYNIPFDDPAYGRLYPRRDAYQSLLCRRAKRTNCSGFAN
jgi:hypothetical protein